MNLILTPIVAILVGLFVRSRLQGAVLYLSIQAVVFTFQTLAVLLAWMSGEGGFGGVTERGAFGPNPSTFPIVFTESELWLYGLVNVIIMIVGVLITLGIITIRNKQRSRSSQSLASNPAV